ncbi:MAG: TonB family protein [Bacteroidales bacterium]|nr:TonB family protein [Bacteroidales bacterium]
MNTRSAIIAAVLAVATAFPLGAQFRTDYSELGDSETVTSFKKHVSTVSAAIMEGRKAGSEGEKMTAEYITEILEGYGVDVLSGKSGDPFGICQENGDTLTSRNVCAFIQGGDKALRNQYIVIGARMDNMGTGSMTVDGKTVEKIYYGANGNASGVAMLLELARMLQTNRYLLRRSVLLVAFGASRQTFAGSWYFLNRSFGDSGNIDAMINLDMVGTGTDGFYAYTSSNADMNAMVESLANELQPINPAITSQEHYPSDQIAFYDKGIPSIMFTTVRYPAHDTERDTQSIIDYETMEQELEYVFNYSVALANGPKPIFNPSEVVKADSGGSGVIPYYDCDVKPSFLGSNDPKVFLQKWVYSYMKYPDEAVKNGIQGRVLVDFIIDESGKVRDVKVLKGADPLLDDEAVRIISGYPSWKPGRVRGKKVSSEMSLYVEFRLEKKGTKSFGLKKY